MQRFLIISVVVLVFAAFLMTYTVRFTEKAVVSTFGRADASSVKSEGLHFKVPFVQKVTKYDSRTRLMEIVPETLVTYDNFQIIVTAYLNWRVDDPLEFYKRYSGSGDGVRDHVRQAEKILSDRLRDSMSEVSKFRFAELFSADESGSALPALEQQILARLLGSTDDGSSTLKDIGIEPISVGISGIAMAQDTTKKVFDQMNQARKKISEETIDQGRSQAATIRSKAEADARRITDFAEALASTIRSQGDIESGAYLAQMTANPQLAVFLQNIAFMRDFTGKTTTLVLPTTMPGLEIFRPDAPTTFRADRIPGPDLSYLTRQADPNAAESSKPATQPTAEARP